MSGKRVSADRADSRDMVRKLTEYFNQEKYNGRPFLPLHAVQERVSQALGISLRTVARISKESQKLEEQGTPNTSTTKYRPRKKNKTEDLSEPVKMELRNVIYSMYFEKKHLTLKTLKEELATKQILDISAMSLCRLLPRIGFRYKKEGNRRVLMEKSNIVALRAEFLRKYKENQNSNIKRQVVFLDETWIVKDNKKMPWQCSSIKSIQKLQTFEGKHFMALHAGHRRGFVENTCVIYATASKLADSHGDINSDIFMNWVKEKLVPNLEEPSLIVMDNTSYNSILLEKLPTSSWTKAQIIQWLQDNNIPVEGNKFKAELLMSVKKHAKHNTYVVDEYIKEHGHKVLRLPPHHCQFNAMDLILTQAKQFYDTHIGEEGYEDDKVLAMWYKSLHSCTPERWASVVKHTESLIDTWYNREHILENVSEFIIGDSRSSNNDFTDSDTD